MPRRREVPKRDILPDPKFGSVLVSRFVNTIMKNGKKSVAERIVYGALETALERVGNKLEERLEQIQSRKEAKAAARAGKYHKRAKDEEEDSGEGSGTIEIKSERVERAVKLLECVLMNVSPRVEVRSRRVGGATYQVPVEVRPERSRALGMRWLVHCARVRNEKGMQARLAAEFSEAFDNHGNAVKKCLDTHRMADANKAFAHFRW